MAVLSQARRTPPPPAPASAADALPLRRLTFPALGTTCEVQYAAPGGDAQANAFEHAAVGWVLAFEAKYSRFKDDSLIGRINAAAGRAWVEADAEAEGLFKLCDTLHFMTQGVLDPTTLPLHRLWDYRAAVPRLPAPDEVARARALVGWKKVRRAPGKVFLPEPGMALDFGGFGKEYAVDMVARLAREHGLSAALVDFGHDLHAVGRPPGRPAWHIGLEDPHRPGTSTESVALIDRSIASSGDYIRHVTIGGRRYGHIIDPRSGWPVAHDCRQVTVIAGSCLQAGVLSTTAFVLGVPKGIEFIQNCLGAEGLLVTDKARAQTRSFFHHVVAR
jgi:thiamine biosynthesis lipoprotein